MGVLVASCASVQGTVSANGTYTSGRNWFSALIPMDEGYRRADIHGTWSDNEAGDQVYFRSQDTCQVWGVTAYSVTSANADFVVNRFAADQAAIEGPKKATISGISGLLTFSKFPRQGRCYSVPQNGALVPGDAYALLFAFQKGNLVFRIVYQDRGSKGLVTDAAFQKVAVHSKMQARLTAFINSLTLP